MQAPFNWRRLRTRTLAHHRRSYALVALVASLATAIITGALFVGDSVRGSLRDRVEDRLGQVDHALAARGYFREVLARDVASASPQTVTRSVAVLLVKGSVTHADTGARASEVNVLGIPPSFWSFWKEEGSLAPSGGGPLSGRAAWVNANLAGALGPLKDSAILIHVQKQGDVPAEHALGRKTGTLRPLRFDVTGILPASGPGLFDLENSQAPVRNVFVPLDTLQRALGRDGFANLLLVAAPAGAGVLEQSLGSVWKLEDGGLRLRVDPKLNHAALESTALLLPPQVVAPAKRVSEALGLEASEALTYLANTISLGDRQIPYSTVAACAAVSGQPVLPGTIVLNDWAAEDLGARPGDRVRLKYYLAQEDHGLAEAETELEVARVVPITGDAADPGWTPEYPGISNAKSLRAWDPPFPVDLARVRPKDDDYWTEHRTTPKAFVSLADGKRMWASRFGDSTSLRFRPLDGEPIAPRVEALEGQLLRALTPGALGLVFRPVKAEGLAAAQGGTDFGGLFVGFSFFIIVSALVLLAMVFRLACERRARELGILKAVGFTPRHINRVLLVDGAILSTAGTFVGSALGIAYAAILLAGLRTLWKGAVNAPFLTLHSSGTSWALGISITVALALATVWLVARKAAASPALSLLGGSIPGSGAGLSGQMQVGSGVRASLLLGTLALVTGVGLGVCGFGEWLAAEAAFFGGGASLCAASLLFFHAWLHRVRRGGSRRPRSMARLGAWNARRAPGRSLLTASLIASASFVIVAVAASRRDPASLEVRKDSGNGGFILAASSAIPVTESLASARGREALGLGAGASALLERAAVIPFRVRPGDDTSCLNLYRPQAPRVLGASRAFVERGGFAWASSLAENDSERSNPWRLLERHFDDGAIPAVGDANTVKWILHLGLGEDVVFTGDDGRDVRLRLVGLLSHSIFQGELVVAESRFTLAFPRIEGSRWFLIEAQPADAEPMAQALESGLEAYGFDVERTGALLASYQAVENTYLSTFQLLGGLGLLLGTFGLGAVLLRNVNERRGELALLRALGASRRSLGTLVLSETVLLLCAGLAAGAGSALLAVLPGAWSRPGQVPWAALLGTLLAIAAAGLASSAFALRSAMRSPLIPALRKE